MFSNICLTILTWIHESFAVNRREQVKDRNTSLADRAFLDVACHQRTVEEATTEAGAAFCDRLTACCGDEEASCNGWSQPESHRHAIPASDFGPHAWAPTSHS